MKIRTRLLLSILPPVIAFFLFGGIVGYSVSNSGLYNIQQDFLRFKSQLLQDYVRSQWNLLVDFSLYTNPEYITVAQEAIVDYATSILKPSQEDGQNGNANGNSGAVNQNTASGETENGAEANSSQVVFAVAETGQGTRATVLSTNPDIAITDSDIRSLFEESDSDFGVTEFSVAPIGGEDYVYTSFYFAPLRWTFFVAERVEIFSISNTIIRRVFTITITLLIVVLTAILVLLSKSLTGPLQRMASTAEGITRDALNIDVQIPHIYDDEAGTLARTLNSTFGELNITYNNLKEYAFDSAVSRRQEERIRTIFQKFVPDKLVNRYIQNPESLLVGENRNIVVLFSDIRGFTTLSESMKPDFLVRFLNRYFAEVTRAVVKAEGVVDKFIGDAVMALFWNPDST